MSNDDLKMNGIPSAVTGALHQAMKTFFALPGSAKRAISRSLDNPWGYYDAELTKNVRDWKEVFDYGPPEAGRMIPQWPQGLPQLRAAVLDFYGHCEKLAFKLLAMIERNLGATPEQLAMHFRGGHSSFLRLNHYPACPAVAAPGSEQGSRLGVNHHTDAGALTILLQDTQPGLQVWREDEWQLVPSLPGALVINLGDMVQVWSNDRYRAALHRVITHTSANRFSAPFFFSPAYSTNYQPLPGTVDAANPARYRSINWGEFRSRRAQGDYGDYGEEVQLNQYRLDQEVHSCHS